MTKRLSRNSAGRPQAASARRSPALFPAALLLGALCLAVAGCSGAETENKPPADSRSDPRETLEVREIVLQELPEKIYAVGIVRAVREVDITPETSGKVKNIYADVGDTVTQDQVLAEIDSEAGTISLEKRKAQLQKAEASLRKTFKDAGKSLSLYNEGVISDSESDSAGLQYQICDADVKLARAEVRAAEKQLRDTKLTAPFNGRIALKDVELGKFVAPGQCLFTLVDIETVKVEVSVSELDVSKIAAGDSPQVYLDSLGTSVQGRVETIGLKADDATRTFPVEIAVPNARGLLLPGMVARVTFKPAEAQKAVLVPCKSVRPVNGSKVVYVMESGRPVQRIVQTGAVMGTDVVIKKGLSPGDRLVVSGGGE